jgi:pimeloyl-ACP methyl ester carboxylesterase
LFIQLIKNNIIFGSAQVKFPSTVSEKRTIPYKDSSISYRVIGRGFRKAVCFHGYGENSASFTFFEKYVGEELTLFAIDLPFHGDTVWNEGLNIEVSDLVKIVQLISGSSENAGSTKLTVVGYSLGGRMALSVYQNYAPYIDRLVLLAPDGLKVNFWYWLATQTLLGNRLFAFTMRKPGWFFGLLKIFNKLRLVNPSIFKFVHYYIGDPHVRHLLYERWTGLRNIRPDLPVIKRLIKAHDTVVSLVYGSHDRIILSSVGNRFQEGIENNCTVTVIRSGHQVLHEKHWKELLPALVS